MELLANRYAILRQLGQGGMGLVFEGVDRHSGRPVAIKRLHAHETSPNAIERFRREAHTTSQLRHPHIVELLDFVPGPPPAIVLELLRGQNLRERLVQQAPLPLEVTIQIVPQVLAALAATHAVGIVHRDVKPANVFLLEEPSLRVKLLDFGIAKLVEPNGPPLTRSQHVVGSAMYMPPEQIRGGVVDARADLFAFGLCIYEMLTGRKSYEGNSAHEAMLRVLAGEPLPRHPALAPAMYDFLRRATHSDATQRHVSAADMARAFEVALHAPVHPVVQGISAPPAAIQPPPAAFAVVPTQSRSAWPWIALIVCVLAVAAVGGVWLWVTPAVLPAPVASGTVASAPPASAPSSSATATASAAPSKSVPASRPVLASKCKHSEDCPDDKQVCHEGQCTSCSAIVPDNPATKIANCNLKHNCTHLNDDRKNCGACGVTCGPVEDCLAGKCVKLGDHASKCSKSADCIDKFVCSKSDDTCRCPLRQNFCGGPGYNGKCSGDPCP